MEPAPQNNQLLPKHRVLGLQPHLRLEWSGQDGQRETQKPDHSASLSDSVTSSTRITFSVHTGDFFSIENFELRDRSGAKLSPSALTLLIDVTSSCDRKLRRSFWFNPPMISID